MLIKKYVSLRTYATISKGSRWSSKVKKPRRIGLLLILAFIIPLVIFASLPQVGVFILAFTDWVTSGIFPSKLTFEYVNQLLTPSVRTAMFNSLTYSILAVLIAVFIGSNASYVVSRVKSSIANILDILSTIPISIPGIVLAVGFFLFFTSYFRGTVLDPLVDPSILLILAYSIRRLPFAARSIFAGLQQVHISLEEAAMNLGANRLHTFIRIVLPLISINIFGGAILTFVYSMSEVSTSVTLGSLRGDRGPITFYISQVVYGSVVVGAVSVGAALCVLLILLQVMAISISNYLLKQRFSIFGM
ncbi:MAG: ABC transporter permease subunit [archaeon GB-1867-097]|nr:ABC transporter permease subunit [Candidatus Culexmicrobium thermophilum]